MSANASGKNMTLGGTIYHSGGKQRRRKRTKLLILILTSSTFEKDSFSYFVYVILLNDVIKQCVKIIEEGDNLKEMSQ